jgi:hypothetical protein
MHSCLSHANEFHRRVQRVDGVIGGFDVVEAENSDGSDCAIFAAYLLRRFGASDVTACILEAPRRHEYSSGQSA